MDVPDFVEHAPPERRLSFWWKLDRADCHIDEVARLASAYEQLRAYRAVPIPKPKASSSYLRWRLQIIAGPDPMLTMAVGDAIHNLRSALDHLVICLGASDPRSAAFPIEDVDPWATNPDGSFRFGDRHRMRFEKAVRGIPEEARAIIEALQPYQSGSNDRYPAVPSGRVVVGVSAEVHPLIALRRIDNADKHRSLSVLATGTTGLCATVHDGRRAEHFAGHFVSDGAQLVEFPTGGRDLGHDEVEVKLDGVAPVLHVMVSGAPAVRLTEGLFTLADRVRAICMQLCRFAQT